MFKLVKYLKNSVVPILAIILLLGIQAVCDLSLPDYTSNIVNVGIQQGGVENAVPKIIRKSEMDKLLLFIDDDNQSKVLDSYTLLEKENLSEKEYQDNLKKYPALDSEPLYKLNEKADIKMLDPILGKAIMIVSSIESDSPESQQMKQHMMANLPPQMAEQDIDVFQLFAAMPKEQLSEIRTSFNDQFANMSDSIIVQGAVSYVRAEYDAVGINTESMQNNYILFAGLKMLGITLASVIAAVMVGFIGARIAASMGRDLRGMVFKKVVSFSNAEFDKFSTASLITRSTNDIQQIQLLMVMLLRFVFYAPILGIGGFIKVLGTNTSMAWIIGVAVLSILLVVVLLFTFVMPKFKIVQKLIDKLNLVTREILTGLPVIRAFSTQKHEEKRFDNANRDLTKTNLFINRIMSGMMPVMMLIMNLITILIVWNGANSVNNGTMQVGDMMAFIQYTMMIIMAFMMISMVSVMLPRASVAAVRVDEVLTSKVTISDPKINQEFDRNKKGVVEFKNVSFRYPNAEEDVLSNISFTAKPGQTTAIIGSTGSGKSTLINLIPRFYDVTEGELLIDGINVKNTSQHNLREKLGYVPQKGVLFSGTIESNIKFGKKDFSDATMVKAAEIAQAVEFINAKPDQYKSEIAQDGTNVSGGQKQRLSIARAVANDPEIFIFDDSFSALDYKTDVALRRALRSETAESTVIIVAQRISTILHAEQIIVLDEGHVAGIGIHQELLKNCEVYQQIALSQLSKEELDHE